MTIARSQQISLAHTAYYHCTSRCVRRAFLCGKDRYSGKSFEHRRQWIEERLKHLSQTFAIDLLAYAIMSNHYHVVIRINAPESACWSDAQVIKRWKRIYSVPEKPSTETVALWRARLSSLSWFMRCINEPLARRANREDDCRGRFWEGRFKSQALLDDAALLKCMAYVDLNPIRARMAITLEGSDHTSIKARVGGKDEHLMPLGGCSGKAGLVIPMQRTEYLALLDWTGRVLRQDKAGAIPGHRPPVPDCLGLEPGEWVQEMRHYGKWYYRAVGSLQTLNDYCEHLGQRWLKGSGHRNTKLARLAAQ